MDLALDQLALILHEAVHYILATWCAHVLLEEVELFLVLVFNVKLFLL